MTGNYSDTRKSGTTFLLLYGSGLTNVFEADTGLSDTTEGSNTVLALSRVGRNHT